MTIDFSKVIPIAELSGEDAAETAELAEMSSRASTFLRSFRWCRSITTSYAGIVIPGVVGVFLFNLTPAERGVDEWLWVIVGDLPPAYVTTDDAPNPAAALDAYIGEMEQWVEAARSGRSVENLIPVNVPPTPEYVQKLSKRLQMLDDLVLSDYEDDLRPPQRN